MSQPRGDRHTLTAEPTCPRQSGKILCDPFGHSYMAKSTTEVVIGQPSLA